MGRGDTHPRQSDQRECGEPVGRFLPPTTAVSPRRTEASHGCGEGFRRHATNLNRRHVDRIARAFSWSCFAPVVVSPVAGGKFAIIDGQHRTTAATLVGFDSVPCQIVIAAKEEQAAAFKAINGTTTPISVMALHAAALVACEPWAV
jgi:hypothetical protein